MVTDLFHNEFLNNKLTIGESKIIKGTDIRNFLKTVRKSTIHPTKKFDMKLLRAKITNNPFQDDSSSDSNENNNENNDKNNEKNNKKPTSKNQSRKGSKIIKKNISISNFPDRRKPKYKNFKKKINTKIL